MDEKKIKEASIKEMANRLNPKSPYYKHQSDPKIHFALFLGAGASIESGVPSANDMINEFIDIICEIECPHKKELEEKEKWVLSKSYYQTPKDKYGSLFEQCFPKAVARRDYIESKVDGRTPSLGYIALAHLLDKKIIDTIITTNFDDLVYQACTSFTSKRPIVFSLGGFASEISATTNRPKVLKVHGDFMFSDLKNTKQDLQNQDPNMSQQVKQILQSYDGLIVIGYAGNDDSIIELLDNIPKEKHLYWCVYQNEQVNDDVKKLLLEKEGWIVRTKGFDMLMNEVRNIIGIENSDIFGLFDERRSRLMEEVGKFNPKDFSDFEKASRLNSQGIELFEKNQFTEAEQYFKEAIKYFPKLGLSYLYLGQIYSKDIRTVKESEAFFKQTIKIEPDNISAYIGLLNLYNKHDFDLESANELYKQAIKINPYNADVYFKFINILRTKKAAVSEIIGIYGEAVSKINDNAQLFVYYGNFLSENGNQLDLEKANKLYSKAIKINKNYRAAYYKTIANLIRLNKIDFAIEYINKVEKIFPDYEQIYLLLGVIYKKQNQTEQLKKVIDKITLMLSEEDVNYYYFKANIEAILENNDKALDYLAKAIKANHLKKTMAKNDLAFDLIRHDPKFKKLVGD